MSTMQKSVSLSVSVSVSVPVTMPVSMTMSNYLFRYMHNCTYTASTKTRDWYRTGYILPAMPGTPLESIALAQGIILMYCKKYLVFSHHEDLVMTMPIRQQRGGNVTYL
jgi:hypothetical protein